MGTDKNITGLSQEDVYTFQTAVRGLTGVMGQYQGHPRKTITYLPQGFEMPEGIVAKTGFLLNHALDGRGGDHIGLWLQKTQANGAAELLKIYTLMCGDGVLRAYAAFDGAPTTAIYQPPRKEGYLSLDLSQTGMVPVGLQDFVEKVYAMRGTNSVRNSSLGDESFRPSFRPRAVLLGERSRPKGDSPY